jgi:hypothetical protein
MKTGEVVAVSKYDLAISYASDDTWLANDLYELLSPYNISIYCYSKMLDASGGRLRENLKQVYDDSRLNLLIWSRSYAESVEPLFPAMERRFLVDRHIYENDHMSLIPISIDGFEIGKDLKSLLFHSIRQIGVTGIEKVVNERLGAMRSGRSGDSHVHHPVSTESWRGDLTLCNFSVSRNFERDHLNRWKNLADVLINFPNNFGTKHVYLIPSGSCQINMRHTNRLRSSEILLEAKRRVSRKFCEQNLDLPLQGYWFTYSTVKSPEAKVVAMYCRAYDDFLNENFERELSVLVKQM